MRLVGRRELRRGVLILPSLFTLGNLFCGFFAIMEAAQGGAGHLERRTPVLGPGGGEV